MSPDGQRTGADAPDADAALVARAAEGDEDAVAAIYDTFARPLYGYGLRRLGDPLLAEELVQSVMTRVWRTGRRYDSERGSVRTWVFTMARSIAIDLYRRQSRTVAPAPVPADRPELADDLDRLVAAEAVRAALDRLSAEHREALELAYFRGLTQAEIATRLGIPLGTVKSRTYYALKAFRLACDELGVDS